MSNATPEIQKQRKAILGSAIDQDANTVAQELKAGWEREWKSLPESVRSFVNETKAEEAYRKEKYFCTLGYVVDMRLASEA